MYKYYSRTGAVATLRNRTVQLSAPAGFNDPFDTHLDDPFGSDPVDFIQELQGAFVDFFLGDIDYSMLREGPNKASIIAIHQGLKTASPAQREGYRLEAMADDAVTLFDIDELRRNSLEVVAYLVNTFSRYGIFCASDRPDILLLWSHYADEHRGFVFKFDPSVKKDSAFICARPVSYTQVRPLMYRTGADMIRKGLMMTLEASTREIIDSLVYTKAIEWNYEEELRLYIPDFVEVGQTRAYLSFHAEELSTVFVGCRTSEEHEREVVALSRAINPKVSIYRAVKDAREYRLGFERVG
jgi:hypothetical protein